MADDLQARLAESGAALRALAADVRRLIDATVSATAPSDALATAQRAVAEALATLAPHVPVERPPRYPTSGDLSDVGALMPFDPIMGALSPIAPPLAIRVVGERAVGDVTFGTPYEGPPGCVHGGVLALAFDQVLNVANLTAGVPGPTKRLTLTFRKPTPLGKPVVFEGWVAERSEREVVSRGVLRHGDVTTVEAEGVFAVLSPERLMRLLDPGR